MWTCNRLNFANTRISTGYAQKSPNHWCVWVFASHIATCSKPVEIPGFGIPGFHFESQWSVCHCWRLVAQHHHAMSQRHYNFGRDFAFTEHWLNLPVNHDLQWPNFTELILDRQQFYSSGNDAPGSKLTLPRGGLPNSMSDWVMIAIWRIGGDELSSLLCCWEGFELEEEDSVGGSIVPDLGKNFLEFVKWSTRLVRRRKTEHL